MSIQDVNTSSIPGGSLEASTLPTGWTTPTGGGLNLITTNVIDTLGRTVETTDPNDDVTFTVYNDPLHETRTYSGWMWNSTTSTYYIPTGETPPPTQVTIGDLPVTTSESPDGDGGTYSEMFAMSATPSSSTFNGVSLPVGGETIGSVTALSISIMNESGQDVQGRAYFNLPSLTGYLGGTGSASVLAALGAGSAWNPSTGAGNYYVTTTQYDDMGNVDKTVNPDGTITRMVFDGLGREISTWVGTNDTPASGYWSPTNNGGTSNMVELTATIYDNGFVGDGNVTGQLSFPAGSSYSNVQDTAMFYDWQDRLVATKSGVLLSSGYSENLSGELTDGTNRPLVVDTLDNLGEVTEEQTYNGNGVAIDTSTGAAVFTPPTGVTLASLLRAQTAAAYDPQGRANQTTQFSVDQSSGAVSTATSGYDAPETTTTYFDPRGLVSASIDAAGRETDYVYDGAWRQTSIVQTDPITDGSDGNANTADYSELITHTTYDGDGNVLSVTDPMGNVTTYAYDAANREISELDPNPSDGSATGGPLTVYAFDAAGNLYSETDPDDNTTTYGYDALGREPSETAPHTTGTGVTSYVFDGDGNVVQTTDPDGNVITDAYNLLDQLTEEKWYNSASTLTNTIDYTWDNLGEMLTAADDNSAYTFEYNSLGQQTSVDNSGTSGVPDVVLASAFDALGNRTSLGATIASTADFQNSYLYDGFGRTATIEQTGATGGDAVADKRVDFTYNADGTFSTIDRYSDLTATSLVAASGYGYDSLARITSLDQGTSSTADAYAGYAWSYDADSRVSTFDNTQHTNENAAYTYDHDSQIASATYAGNSGTPAPNTPPDESYSFDANGNPNGGGDSVDADQLQSDGTYTYSFDANGNEIEKATATTEQFQDFDARNQLMDVRDYVLESGSWVETDKIDYTYDMFGNLIGRSETPYVGGVAGTTTTQRNVFDNPAAGPGQPDMVLSFDGNKSLTDRYLYGPAVDQILADEQFTPTGSNQLPTTAGNTLYPLPDNEGSIRDVLQYNASTTAITTVEHIVYTSFGAVAAQTGTVTFAFGYTGEYTDVTTADQLHGVRWYDPIARRWVSPDPIGLAPDSNFYRAFANSPINAVDPTGEALLTKARLVQLVQQYGLDRDPAGNALTDGALQQRVGEVFEQSVFAALGLLSNPLTFPSPARLHATGGAKGRTAGFGHARNPRRDQHKRRRKCLCAANRALY